MLNGFLHWVYSVFYSRVKECVQFILDPVKEILQTIKQQRRLMVLPSLKCNQEQWKQSGLSLEGFRILLTNLQIVISLLAQGVQFDTRASGMSMKLCDAIVNKFPHACFNHPQNYLILDQPVSMLDPFLSPFKLPFPHYLPSLPITHPHVTYALL